MSGAMIAVVLAGGVLAALSVPVLEVLLRRARQANADDVARDAAEAALLASGVEEDRAWDESRSAVAAPVIGPSMLSRVPLTVFGMAAVVEVVLLVLWVTLPHPVLLVAFGPLVLVGALLFVIDWRTHRLPDVLVWPLLLVVAGGLVVSGIVTGEWPVGRALASAGAWLLLLGVLCLGGALATGTGLGLGDVKLGVILGLALGWLGWGASLSGLGVGFGIAALAIGVLMVVRRAPVGKDTPFAFGPALLLGALFGAAVGQPVLDAFLLGLGA
jgi:leader peptidase (prepilin peptidase)/N-methyltransferase